jgi:hypothetical protein
MPCLDRHPSGNRTPHAGSEDTTTTPCKTRRNRHISRMQQERPSRYRGSARKGRYRSLGENTTTVICMMMTSYNNFVAELLVIFRGIYDGGGPLLSPCPHFNYASTTSPSSSSLSNLDSKPQSLSPLAPISKPPYPSPVARLSDEGVLFDQLA